MSITAARSTALVFTGDRANNQTLTAAQNAASPGQEQVVRLAAGDNVVNVPAGTTPTAVIVQPPVGNPNLIILKGVGGDTGVKLHKTDHAVIAIDSTVASFVLNAAAQTDVRLYWL